MAGQTTAAVKTPAVRLLAALACAATATATARAAPVVTTQAGQITGIYAGGMREFLGIRYAAPPVAAARWMPPQPVPPHLVTHKATAFGPHCAQLASPFVPASTSEDCLYLNIYAPKQAPAAGQSYPVLVWIHGGDLLTGESDDYDPAPLLAANPVIVVTLNYRLGYFGFFATPGLDNEGHPAANYGLQDQQFALLWVQTNIAAFGGDPTRVTLAGESAGGLSTLAGLASPTARGLFTQAIVQSGAYALHLPTLAQAEQSGDQAAAALGCAGTNTACLRAAPATAILALQAASGATVTPAIDGTTLPRSLDTALSSGHFNHLPLINGSNHDEGRQFTVPYAALTAQQYAPTLAALFGTTLATQIAANYPVTAYTQPVLALAAVATDYAYACPAHLVDQWVSHYAPTYGYEFNDRNAPQDILPPTTYKFGAYHGAELQFLFKIPKLPNVRKLNAAELALSASMTAYWTNFATTRSPNASTIPNWLPYTGNVQSLVPATPVNETNFSTTHHCAFWDALIK
jgi:para-nitrobenzyl esterase